MTRVSVVIPCYNSEEHLLAALASVESQSYPHLELICVNDGSTDNTSEVLRSWRSERLEMMLIEQENQGANHARNVGTSKATGEYIQYLDADDVLCPEKIARQVQQAEDSGNPSLIIGSYRKVKEDGSMAFEKVMDEVIASPWLSLMRTDLGITSSNLFKRSVVRSVQGWDENLKSSQEYDLMFRMLQYDDRIAVSTVLDTLVLQRSSGSITSTAQGSNWKRYVELRIRIKDYVQKSGVKVDRSEVDQILFDAIRMLYLNDAELATSLYKEHLPSNFKPQASDITSPSYVRLFRFFGFRIAEGLRALFR